MQSLKGSRGAFPTAGAVSESPDYRPPRAVGPPSRTKPTRRLCRRRAREYSALPPAAKIRPPRRAAGTPAGPPAEQEERRPIKGGGAKLAILGVSFAAQVPTPVLHASVQVPGRPRCPRRPEEPGRGRSPAQLKPELIARWKGVALEGLETLFQRGEQRDQDRDRIAELERMAGRLTTELEVANKASNFLPSTLRRDGRSS